MVIVEGNARRTIIGRVLCMWKREADILARLVLYHSLVNDGKGAFVCIVLGVGELS
jgi:hypothetical protein